MFSKGYISTQRDRHTDRVENANVFTEGEAVVNAGTSQGTPKTAHTTRS